MAKNLSEKLHESLSTVIIAVNKIKANALNSQLFHQLCIENDERFSMPTSPYRSSVGCRKVNCLKRFYTLFSNVLDFFQESNPELFDKLKSIKTDIAYVTVTKIFIPRQEFIFFARVKSGQSGHLIPRRISPS